MKISEKRMEEILPQNIKDSELLSLASKKVLAALLDWYLNSEAKTTKVVIISNKILCSIAGVGGTSLQESLRELNDYNLVTRTIGTKLGDASKYNINFKNLVKPLQKQTFESLFSEELEEAKSQETPISTIVKNSIVENSIVKNRTVQSSIEQTSTDKLSTDNKYFQEFKGFVDENLVGENEGELINKRVEISNNLKKKELEIGKTMCNRCSSYLNRKFEEAVASI